MGVLRYLHFRKRNQITVLMLHGVMAKHEGVIWEPLRSQLCPAELERILRLLSDYYHFISIEQCIDMLDGKIPMQEHSLLITFDDGYRNNIDYALPVCERFNIKPVLFVSTCHIDSSQPFWFDRLDYALQQNMGGQISLGHDGRVYNFDGSSREKLTVSYQNFRNHCKQTFDDDNQINKLFSALCEELEKRSSKALSDICKDDDWSAIATWPQLRDCVKNNRLDIASHTVNHWRLDRLSEELITSQLVNSKNRIEQEIGTQCCYFCYPNGSYNEMAVNLIKQTGYRAAFSTDVGLCQYGDDLMTLKRFSFPVGREKFEIIYLLTS